MGLSALRFVPLASVAEVPGCRCKEDPVRLRSYSPNSVMISPAGWPFVRNFRILRL